MRGCERRLVVLRVWMALRDGSGNGKDGNGAERVLLTTEGSLRGRAEETALPCIAAGWVLIPRVRASCSLGSVGGGSRPAGAAWEALAGTEDH